MNEERFLCSCCVLVFFLYTSGPGHNQKHKHKQQKKSIFFRLSGFHCKYFGANIKGAKFGLCLSACCKYYLYAPITSDILVLFIQKLRND